MENLNIHSIKRFTQASTQWRKKVDLERKVIFAQLEKTVRTNHSLLYGAVLCTPAWVFLVKTMKFLSARQKQGSGSHMVNQNANHRSYSLQNWWAHYKGSVAVSLIPLHLISPLKHQAEKENCL